MEIHPPDHPIMTWKQFLIHMGTIVLGLLIALALEQSVEALHHSHQRKELREAMERDLEQIRRDCAKDYRWLDEQEEWGYQRTVSLQLALDKGQPPAPLPRNFHAPLLDLLADTSFDTAKTNGRLALLPDEDVSAFNEMDTLLKAFNEKIAAAENTQAKINAMYIRFGAPEGEHSDWSHATPAEKSAFVEMNAEFIEQYVSADGLVREVYGAATALRDGKRDLPTLYVEERKISRKAAQTLFTDRLQEPK